MSEETPLIQSSASQQASSNPNVSVEQSLSEEDKYVLYAILQDIANEIRRIDREYTKRNQKREPAHYPLGNGDR
jgi:hypothetical protein